MDPLLQELADGPPDDRLEAIIKLADPSRPPAGFQPVARFGPVATGRLRRGDIRRIWADPTVLSLKAPRLLEFTEVRRPPPVRPADARRPPVPERGRGVVVGVIDWGLDVTCPAFRLPSGGTRVLGFWDQAERAGAAPAPYGYGRMFDRAAIDRALGAPDPHAALGHHPAASDAGDGSHGTHVLDIAAGNGRHGGPEGLAPEADLAFVHLAAGALGGLANLGDSVRILEGLDYIRATAAGRPFVVNLSVGRHSGPHTGGTLLEQAIDALVAEAPGRAVVMSAGNYHHAAAHASGRLTPGRPASVTWMIGGSDPTTNELEVWYPEVDRFHVVLEGPGGSARVEAGLGQNPTITVDGRPVGRLYHRAHDPNTPDHHVNLFLHPGAPEGAWRLTLLPVEIRDGRWHAWVERDSACPDCQSRFDAGDVTRTHTTGSICNGFLSIAVGALDTRGPVLRVADFSSSGPTRDGRQKPDLVAPGVAVLAARSAPASGPAPPLVRKSGASQAAPYVAGLVALMFEAAARPLDIQETRALLLGSARPLPLDPLRAGAGAADPEAALRAARGLRGVPSLSTLEVPMNTQPLTASAFPAAEAARLLDTATYSESLPAPYAARFDLVAAPWQPAESLRRGDVVISRPPAGHAAEVSVIADCAPAQVTHAASPERLVLRLREQAQPGPYDPENLAAVPAVVGVISDVVQTLGGAREMSGSYKITTQDAYVTPYPRSQAPMAPFRTRIEYTLMADHPRWGFSNQRLVFYVDMVSDCLNIYSVQIQKNDERSSELYLSSFELEFRPNAQQPPGFGATAIDYAISGRWNAFGRGDWAFSGRLVVMADGRMRMFQIQPREGWVWLEEARRLEGQVACPPPATTPAPGSVPQAPIAPPADRRPSATDALRARLRSGPHIEHVFFTTNTLELRDQERNRLQGWFNNLSATLQRQITNGELIVYVDGHASPGGPADANMRLSLRRAEAAAAALRPIVGANAVIRPQGFGSQQAIGTPGSNDQADRRATVRIEPR